MSLCAPCIKLNTISFCTDSIVIGVAPLANTPYVVYFKSLATGSVYSYNVTSGSTKIITLQLVAGLPLADGTVYEMWINAKGDSIETQKDLIIGTTTAKCYSLIGNNVFNAYYSVNENYVSQALVVYV